MGLSPLTRIVTNLERHLLSLSNRDFAARTHPALADLLQDLVVGEGLAEHWRNSVRSAKRGQFTIGFGPCGTEFSSRLAKAAWVKFFSPRIASSNGKWRSSFCLPEALESDSILARLRREAKAAAALDHPFICKVTPARPRTAGPSSRWRMALTRDLRQEPRSDA